MKPLRFSVPVAALSLLSACRVSCGSASSLSIGGGELRAGLESRYLLRAGDGTAMLGIVIQPADVPARRQPVALALVIDTSGSMEGLKIDHARSAARAILDALADGDEVSLTSFDDTAHTEERLTRVDAPARARLRDAVDRLSARTSTALYDGLVMGLESLAPAHHPIRRLVLISDGYANVGPSTPQAILAGLPPSPARVTLSTLGVGTDYDEDVMTAIASRGGGAFHHLSDPVQLTQILEDELQHARIVVGTDAVVEVKGRPGVAVVDGAGLVLSRAPDGTVQIPVGNLYAGQRRSLAVRVRVPLVGSAEEALGSVRLSYRRADHADVRTREIDVRYTVATSADQVTRGAVPEFMVAADRTRVAHVLGDAAALLKEGDLLEAQALLREERTRLLQRRDQLGGPARAQADALVAMLRDPYVDANLAASSQTSRPPPAPPHRLAALVEKARAGQPLPESDLSALDQAQLRILRNTPYARHGYPFHAAHLQRHFAALGWYHPDASFDSKRLSRTDADNVALVHAYEGRASLQSARPATAHAEPTEIRRQLAALLRRAQDGEAIDPDALRDLDLGQLRLLRNVSYARHGYRFRTLDMQAAFAAEPWYHPDPAYQESRLTAKDQANIRMVQERERALLAQAGSEALRDFELKSRASAWRALHQ